jgi:hypothetical protein
MSEFKMSEETTEEMIGWKAACNGTGKMRWFVMHHERRLYCVGRKGLRRYGSRQAAEHMVKRMNKDFPSPEQQHLWPWFNPDLETKQQNSV